MTEDRSFPFMAWVLYPSLKPVEIEVAGPYRTYGSGTEYVRATSGKLYSRSDLHDTKDAAIAAGWAAVERMQADIDKRTENLGKKRAVLNKAAGEIPA